MSMLTRTMTGPWPGTAATPSLLPLTCVREVDARRSDAPVVPLVEKLIDDLRVGDGLGFPEISVSSSEC